MDFCTCKVTLSGDSRSQVIIPRRRAVSYAEIMTMRHIHGGVECVTDIVVVEQRDVVPANEKAYLQGRYDPEVVDGLFPGMIPTLPESAADDPYLIDAPKPKAKRKRAAKKAGAGSSGGGESDGDDAGGEQGGDDNAGSDGFPA